LLLSFLGAIGEELGQFLQLRQTQQSLVDAQQEVLQANKMDTVGRLVGGVVHDFNNLLTIILGYGELVLEESAASSASRDLVSQVLDAGKRAAGLTRQLLGFCRKEAAEPIAVNLNAHIAEMQKMIGRLIGEQIVLSTNLAADAGYVRFAPAHLEQVIMNLVVNARDAMPNGGQLKIQTQFVESGDRELRRFSRAPLGRYALLSVSDSGCGMDQTTRKRIFEPFFTTKVRDKGTGMGLATVFELLADYEGRIEVESSPGRGTTFFVLLPSMEPGLTSWQVDESPIDVPGGDETVLIVEDDDRVRQLMVRGLSARGYQVLSAADPARALELCEQADAHIDVLISDVMLPGIKGPELVIRVRSVQPSLRVLYVSGYGDAELKDAELVKSAAYLQKPFSTFDLARKVRELCDS
jgi:two-component system cell cycle sensor histidine kinase/response regulator CckA